MPKIVIDARESGTSTGRYVDKLIEYLHKLKPAGQFMVLTKPARIDYIKNIAPTFEVVESNFKEFTFAEQLGFARQLKKLKADLIHFGMTQQPVLYRGKAITTVHDLTTLRFTNPAKNRLVFWFKQLVYSWVVKKVARKSALVITPSQFVKEDLVKYAACDPAKIKVTYEAADKITDPPAPVSELLNTSFLLYVGRPLPHKNLGRLIDAFRTLRETKPELKLVLAGQKDVLYQKIENKNIPGVVVAGFVSEAELRWLYENCGAYIFPSLSEGFGLPGLEAMAHGAPVVCSNATALPEIYGTAAQYFDPLDVADIAAKIAAVLDNKSLRQKLITAGSARAKKYSWTKMAEQTLAIYKQVLGE